MIRADKTCEACSVPHTQCFCNLSAQTLHELQSIGKSIHLKNGEILTHEGFAVEHVYMVCDGMLKLSASSIDGKLLLLRIVGPGDVLGLASALSGTNHQVTAEALEPCELKAVGRTQFLTFMSTFSDVSRNSVTALANKYDLLLHSARRLALSSSAAGKLAGTLLHWGRMRTSDDGVTISFRMPLTHEELGSMAGLSRETVTRLLTKFRHEGLIRLEDGMMILPAPKDMEDRYCC